MTQLLGHQCSPSGSDGGCVHNLWPIKIDGGLRAPSSGSEGRHGRSRFSGCILLEVICDFDAYGTAFGVRRLDLSSWPSRLSWKKEINPLGHMETVGCCRSGDESPGLNVKEAMLRSRFCCSAYVLFRLWPRLHTVAEPPATG